MNHISDPSSYKRLIGRLLYLTHTRPDISFAVSNLSQLLDSPTTEHYQAAMTDIRYIKGSSGHDLFFPTSSDTNLKGFSDSDWGTCPDSRKSITGFSFLEPLWFHGRAKSIQQYLDLLQMQNIGPWHKQLMKHNGSFTYYVILASNLHNRNTPYCSQPNVLRKNQTY